LLKERIRKRCNGPVKNKTGLITLLMIGVITISLDLFTTELALLNPNNYEANLYGNMPLIYYPLTISCIYILYCFEEYYKLNHYISLIYSLFPLIAVINNLMYI